ncbi:MAG: hypothetical protein ACI9NC_006357, partial [Verrucomicrobiales bacterium]
MDLDDTKKFLLVKAVEEADRDGGIIPLDQRSLAGKSGPEEEVLVARSQHLYDQLADQHPRQVGAAMTATASHSWLKFAIVVIAFLVGLATKQLGPERRINVLAFPLFGVLAWNLVIYFAALLGLFLRKKSEPATGMLAGVVKRLAARGIRQLDAGGDQHLAAGLSKFVGGWYALTANIRVTHSRGCLHLGAAALSLGVIAGMYWNGLAYQYLAAWESTFLSAEGVHQLFSNLFTPASLVSGLAVPGIDEIRTMELTAGDEGAPAAVWIHLFAITVGLFVVLPRGLMALAAHLKAGKLERAIDFREAAPRYIERLFK